jgi:hypothetical protein
LTLDEHDGHERPRLFVAENEPRYVAVCAPHAEPGPWGPWVPYVPQIHSQERLDAMRAAAPEAEPYQEDVAAEVAGKFALPMPPEDRAGWATYTRGEVVAAALRGIAGERGDVEFNVAWCAEADERREHVVRRHFRIDDARIVMQDDRRVEIRTRSVDDVAFLLSYHVCNAVFARTTLIVRAPEPVCVIFSDPDDDRLYFVEDGETLLRHVLWAANERDLEVLADPGPVWIASGTPEYAEMVREWLRSRSPLLPDWF